MPNFNSQMDECAFACRLGVSLLLPCQTLLLPIPLHPSAAATAPWAAAENYPFCPCNIEIQVSWTIPSVRAKFDEATWLQGRS